MNIQNSLGGFDIYETKVDVNKLHFTHPVALPFPLNTQWNDYYFFPDKENYRILISDRQNIFGEISIYRILEFNEIKENKENQLLADRCFFQNKFILNSPYQKQFSNNEEKRKEPA